MSTARPGPRSPELRLALALRGGVSLAVWMGGACCEMARLREAGQALSAAAPAPPPPAAAAGPTADPATDPATDPAGRGAPDGPPTQPPPPPQTPPPPADVYGRLLKTCGYRDVDIDVLAGTSAGGLNAVLLACHLVYGMPFDTGVRDLWLRIGDLEGLLRRSRPFHVPDSLLRGDEVFYAGLRRALDDLLGQGTPPGWRPVRSLRLILTATRLRPRSDRVRPTLGQPLLVARSNAYFRFRHRKALTDFPDGPGRAAALDRLAFAARTSSSFPGAFEPGKLYVGNEPPPLGEPARVDMRGVSSETGYPDENLGGCAEMVDGGLLDNIPVAWAVRAVAGAPVTRKADRWLLFLQPVPPSPPKPEPADSRRVTRLVKIATRSLAVKAGSESLRDDALELRAADAAAQQKEGLTGVLPVSLDALEFAGVARLDSYRRTVGLAEAKRLVRLLDDPAEVTGPDALPLPAGPGPLEPLDDSPGQGSATLFAALRQASPTLLTDPRGTPLALARTVRLLMDWVWAYEAGTAGLNAFNAALAEERISRCRTRLYALRMAVATLIAARDRLLLRAYADALAQADPMPQLRADPLAPYRLAGARLAASLPGMPPADAPPEAWHNWSATLAGAVDIDLDPAPEGPESGYAQLWDRLGAAAWYIAESLGPTTVEGYEALHAAPDPGELTHALQAAEVLLGPLRPDPLAEATDICFHTISAANTSWATRRVLGDADALTPNDLVTAKLSGNQLANFAAFLSTRWRIGDWTWGRLDAAASLVSVVATDDRLRAAFGEADGDELAAQVAAAMPAGSPFPQLWVEDVAARPDVPRWDRVRDVLTALRQREILDAELPMIAALHHDGVNGGNRPDLPPEPAPLTGPDAFEAALGAFRDIGAEDVGSLVRARDPRRAALRTGLLVWPALQPSGRGPARVAQAVLGLLKPPACLLPLVAVLAPGPALLSAALMWTGIAFCTDRWSSLPGHVPLCLFAMAALAAAARRTTRHQPRPLRYAALLPLALPPVLLWLLSPFGSTCRGGPATAVVGVSFALAAAILLHLGADRPGPIAVAAVAAVVAGGVAALIQAGRAGLGGWWGALVLYTVLAVVVAALPHLYPKPQPPPGAAAARPQRPAPGPRLG